MVKSTCRNEDVMRCRNLLSCIQCEFNAHNEEHDDE